MADGEIHYVFRVTDDGTVKLAKVKKTSDDAANALKGLDAAMLRADKGLSVIGSTATQAAIPIAAMTAGIAYSVVQFDASAVANAQLERALGKSSSALTSQAIALSKKTRIDDDATIAAQSHMASILAQEKHIQRLTPLVQDLATATGKDLNSAADLVTKSIAGSAMGLQKLGLQVTGAAGSTERLESVVKALTIAYGGAAEAAGNVGAGGLIKIKNQMDNLAESIGERILPSLDFWSEKVGNLTEEWLEFLGEAKKNPDVITTSDVLTQKVSELQQLKSIQEKEISDLRFLEESLAGSRGPNIKAANEKRIAELQQYTDARKKQILDLEAVTDNLAKLQTKESEAARKLEESKGVVKEGLVDNEGSTKQKSRSFDFSQTKTGSDIASRDIAAREEQRKKAFADQMEEARLRNDQETQSYLKAISDKEKAEYDRLDKELDEHEKAEKKKQDMAEETERKRREMSLMTSDIIASSLSTIAAADKKWRFAAKLGSAFQAGNNVREAVTKTMSVYGYTPQGIILSGLQAAAGFAMVNQIMASKYARGGDFVTNGPQLIMVGDNFGGRERVQITPQSSPNVNGPKNNSGQININISGGLIDDRFARKTLVPMLREAMRFS